MAEQANPAKSPSDARGWLNARGDIRRMFRADGLSLKETVKVPALRKALALPKPTDSLPDQVKLLQAEVADLTDVLLELAGTMTLVRDHVIAQTPPVPVAPPRSSIRSLRVIDFLSEAWSSLDAIARDMALPKTTVYRKLYYLRQRGQVEASGDKWRRKKPGLRLVEASPE